MAVFSTPFTTPANYFYDASKIEVTGGLAKLKETDIWNGIQVYYRMEESLWNGTINEVIDSSDQIKHATAFNGANTIPVGKVGRGSSFDGVSNYVVSTDNIDAVLTGNPDFTIAFWVYVPTGAVMTGGQYRQFFSFGAPTIPNLAQITNYATTPNQIYVGWYGGGGQYTSNQFPFDTWVHIIWSRIGGGKVRDGNSVYFDNVLQGLVTSGGTGDPNTLAGPFKIQRGVPSDQRFIQCFMDEVCVWSRLLTSDERVAVYNAGAGVILNKYSYDKPTIYKTAGDSDVIGAWNNFVVTKGTVEGSLTFQLSEDGITWKYWNGSAWVAAVGEQYNIESTVNTNIVSFPTAQNKIYIRTWLISDGSQQVEIDEIQISYTSNFPPVVDAGTNKTIKDNTSLKPFNDSTFSDSDGSVTNAYYKIDGEVDTWIEILQGAYGSLIEAVQDFSYIYNNLGSLTTRLKAKDNLGAETEDFLIVTVEKYTKTVNVKDVITGEHILNFDFNSDDGSGTVQKDSPFTWDWEYGSFDITIEKFFFYKKIQNIFVENEEDITIFLQASAFLNECKAAVGLMTEDDKLAIHCWLQQGGELISNPTSCVVELYDEKDVLRYTGSSSVHVGGHFAFEKSPSNLPNEGVYHVDVTIVAGSIGFTSVIPIGLMERKLISFEGAVHIDVDNGSSGTDFPHGTPLHRVNNYADAKVIADNYGLKTFVIRGTLVLDIGDDLSGFVVKAESSHTARIELCGCETVNTSFEDIEIYGQINGFIHIHHCHITEVTGLRGHVHNALLIGPITLGGNQETIISDSGCGLYGGDPVIIDVGGTGQVLELHGFIGDCKIINKTNTDIIQLDIASGSVLVDSTCIAGIIIVRGDCDVTDNSGQDCTVIRPFLQDLHDEALGKWILDPTDLTLTYYRRDGSILQKFDLPTTRINILPIIGRIPQ